jgi:hypothetical protein
MRTTLHTKTENDSITKKDAEGRVSNLSFLHHLFYALLLVRFCSVLLGAHPAEQSARRTEQTGSEQQQRAGLRGDAGTSYTI